MPARIVGVIDIGKSNAKFAVVDLDAGTVQPSWCGKRTDADHDEVGVEFGAV